MEGQFHVDRGARSTAQESFKATPAFEPNGPRQSWQFVDEFQQLVGDDSEPDPLFFVESWTSGMPAAVENLKQRRRAQEDRERQSRAFREFETPATLPFILEKELNGNFLYAANVAAIAGGYDGAWSQQSPEVPSARIQDPAPQPWDTFPEECGSSLDTIHPMTQHRACQILDVSATSTPKQIKAAYKHMVSQWHPDRLERGTEEVRQLATKRMTAINEAYRLLRSTLT